MEVDWSDNEILQEQIDTISQRVGLSYPVHSQDVKAQLVVRTLFVSLQLKCAIPQTLERLYFH